MKLKVLLLAFLFFCSAIHAQHVSVQKTTLAAKEGNAFQSNQSAAINTRTGQTVVVWEKTTGSNHSILGRILNAQGIPMTNIITMVAGPNASHPHVVYNPARNEFMLSYDNSISTTRTHTDVFVKRLNAQGRPLGAFLKVTTDSISSLMWNFSSRILFDPNTGAYSILWIRESVSAAQAMEGNSGLAGSRLNVSGGQTGRVALIQKTTTEFDWPVPLDARYHPSSGRLLVVYALVATGTNGTQANYFFANLDSAFNSITPSNFKKVNITPIQLSSQFAWGAQLASTAGFVVFVDNTTLKRKKIEVTGQLSSAPPLVAFRPPKTNTRLYYPGLAYSSGAAATRGMLVAVQDAFSENGSATLWAQTLDPAGLPLGTPAKIDTTSSTDTAVFNILSTLPPPATASELRYAVFYSLAGFSAPGQTFVNSGLVQLNLRLLLP